MTIDRVIMLEQEKAREYRASITEGNDELYIRCSQYHEKIAEWLEELKKYQSYKPVDKEFYKNGYTKAIDDFADKIKDICKNHSTSSDRYDNEPIYAHKDGTWHSLIDDIVQQLKEGSADNE